MQCSNFDALFDLMFRADPYKQGFVGLFAMFRPKNYSDEIKHRSTHDVSQHTIL